MATTGTQRPVAELVDAFASAPPGQLHAEYQRLVGALWNGGDLTDLALPATPELVARLHRVDEQKQGLLAILLGLLAEAASPTDGELAAAVRSSLDWALPRWSQVEPGQPLSLALQYLLSHFPDDRHAILTVARHLRLELDDMSRLERALQRFDPADPPSGRVFPYPAVWELDEAERAFDEAFAASLTPAQVEQQWHDDTQTVLGFTGAKAYWAVNNGPPTRPGPDLVPPRHPRPADADTELFTRHAAALRCPDCGGALSFQADAARCVSCSGEHLLAKGMLSLLPGAGPQQSEDFMLKLSTMASMGYFLEAHARPNFKRLCSYTWDGAITPNYEKEQITQHVQPVDGPVLDIGAGSGGFTQTLVGRFGPERVIALDLIPAMLATLRHRLPEVPAVVASATDLPFRDESIGAAMCWNGPQALFDDAPAMIAEVGRCLRPGGTFTTFTFLASDDPIYRYFVRSHRFPQHSGGLRMFELDDLKQWLASGGLSVQKLWNVGLGVFIVAQK